MAISVGHQGGRAQRAVRPRPGRVGWGAAPARLGGVGDAHPGAARPGGLLRLPAGRERLLLVHALRPALRTAVGRPAQLPIPVHAGPEHRQGQPEHPVVRRDPGAGADRQRPGGGRPDRARQARRRVLAHAVLPAGARAARGVRRGLRLPVQPGNRAGEPRARAPRDPRTPVVQRPSLVETVPRAAGHVGARRHHDHLLGGTPGRPARAVRGGVARRRQRPAEGPSTSRSRTSCRS